MCPLSPERGVVDRRRAPSLSARNHPLLLVLFFFLSLVALAPARSIWDRYFLARVAGRSQAPISYHISILQSKASEFRNVSFCTYISFSSITAVVSKHNVKSQMDAVCTAGRRIGARLWEAWSTPGKPGPPSDRWSGSCASHNLPHPAPLVKPLYVLDPEPVGTVLAFLCTHCRSADLFMSNYFCFGNNLRRSNGRHICPRRPVDAELARSRRPGFGACIFFPASISNRTQSIPPFLTSWVTCAHQMLLYINTI